MHGHHERFTNAAFILTRQSQTVILRFANPSANSGSSKNRRLNGASTKGDASVPTPLHTAPAPTRPGTLIPDFGLKRSFERKLNSLHFLQHLSNIIVILISNSYKSLNQTFPQLPGATIIEVHLNQRILQLAFQFVIKPPGHNHGRNTGWS